MNNKVILETKKVLDIEGTFYVPDYQRGYRWGTMQVKTLLSDLYENAKTPGLRDKDYCLQPIVVKTLDGENKVYELVDGQQRLTTLYIVLSYLNEKLNMDEYPYTIEYETRPGSKEYLKNIDPDSANDNVDYFHIYNAYKSVEDWAKENSSSERELRTVLNKLNDYLFDHVKVIWYEVSGDEDARSLFTRLNIGRIQLTNAELVRALFLRREDENEVGRDELEISIQWDNMEKQLRADNDDFWYFMTKESPDKYPTRIELLFNMISKKFRKEENENEELTNEKQDDYYTFFYFSQQIAERGKKDIWTNIVKKFLLLKEWYTDNELYHKIGYLIASGKYSMVDIFESSVGHTKSNFKKSLKTMIADTINWPYDNYADDLNYEKTEDKKRINTLLLLFNVQSILKYDVYQRFPFREYNNSLWSLEHIHAQQSEGLHKSEEQIDWIKLQLPVVDSIADTDEVKVLVEKMNDFIADGAKNTYEIFDEIRERVVSLLSQGTDSERMHTLENMALLQRDNNAALNNSTFGAKRNKIIDMDKDGKFIPYCTKKVFLKYYTKSENVKSKFYFWAKEDREAYLEEMKNVLDEYLVQINKEF